MVAGGIRKHMKAEYAGGCDDALKHFSVTIDTHCSSSSCHYDENEDYGMCEIWDGDKYWIVCCSVHTAMKQIQRESQDLDY
jgi:hypothetical protein